MSETLMRQVLRREYRSQIYDEVEKELRDQILSATLMAIATGDIPHAEREQRIGHVQGLKEALSLFVDTHERMVKEDD